ncbi:MAG TPA: hypothetical protein VJR47_11005 [Stellaceae bacterium]|nr:hypothetical protein [Stellaceae bacterium]
MTQFDRIAANRTRNFEVQRRVGERWLLDTVADDKQIAINLANALLKSGQGRQGVQVIAVLQTEDGHFKEVRVYRAMPDDARKTVPAARSRSRAAAQRNLRIDRAAEELKRERPLHTAAPKPKLGFSAAWAAFRRVSWQSWAAVAMVFLWCAIFYLWRQPETPWAFDSPAAQRAAPTSNSFESKFRTIFTPN